MEVAAFSFDTGTASVDLASISVWHCAAAVTANGPGLVRLGPPQAGVSYVNHSDGLPSSSTNCSAH
ncbi:MAG: hypothetical protein Q9Q40_15610, partial [Acidobacteriota bacterium]|nr:hypothetical protein [Acidobacteriota bacterium]